MKPGPPCDNSADPLLDDRDPIFRLLGQSPLPQPEAWFTAKTLARCRQAAEEPATPAFNLLHRWLLGSGLALSLVLIVAIAQLHSVYVASTETKNVQEAFEIVASIDPDSDAASSTPSSTWQDQDSTL